jgi:hypothetical protein
MYLMVTEEFRGRKDGKPGTVTLRRSRTRTNDIEQITKDLVQIMRDADDRFSGMEDFGEAHGFWHPDHKCRLQIGEERSDECKELELESCAEWIRKRLGELRCGETEDFHLGRPGTETSYHVTVQETGDR